MTETDQPKIKEAFSPEHGPWNRVLGERDLATEPIPLHLKRDVV
jgi:hypothetical protein